MLSPESWVLKQLAARYGLRNAGGDLLEMYDRSQDLYDLRTRNPSAPELRREEEAIAKGFKALAWNVAEATRGGRDWSERRGHRFVKTVELERGPFVVFSDHHITYRGHAQDFFAGNNAGLYAEVLNRYGTDGFTVIENGDVEELVIFDPTQHVDQYNRLISARSERELKERRRTVRLAQLARLLRDPVLEPWVQASSSLASHGKLIRIAGNHDFDLQKRPFRALLRRTLRSCLGVYDHVLLTQTTGGSPKVKFAILHGHQFDHVANPESGPRLGETISECRGVWFQGADRVWRWDVDGIDSWLTPGQAPLWNVLVSARAGNQHLENWRKMPPQLVELYRDPPLAALFEKVLFKKNLAWEYFDSQGFFAPIVALVTEVMPGLRFAKFRHMDEEAICEAWEALFPRDTPVMVLGHSHEVRCHPYSVRKGEVIPYYANSGAAGRFQNLVWGIEISRDGEHRLVSWHRRGLTGAVRRTVWRARDDTGLQRVLVPAER